jgi:hypothetical protein
MIRSTKWLLLLGFPSRNYPHIDFIDVITLYADHNLCFFHYALVLCKPTLISLALKRSGNFKRSFSLGSAFKFQLARARS